VGQLNPDPKQTPLQSTYWFSPKQTPHESLGVRTTYSVNNVQEFGKIVPQKELPLATTEEEVPELQVMV
jgi:hypothetical protein